MRITLKCTLVAVLLISAVGCSQRLKQAARLSVLDSDTSCGETSYRTLEVEIFAAKNDGRPALKLNGNKSDWSQLPVILHDVLLTRMEKFIYLRIQPGVSSSEKAEMFRMIESAGAERLCLLDFKAPHKYIRQMFPAAP